MQPFLALITPVGGGGEPTHPIVPGGGGPGIWPSPGYPTHPIAPGGGIGIWPSPGYPTHPIAPGGGIGIWPSPGYPTHPIAPGGGGPGIWPSPGYPTHPIVPGGGVGIWPSPGFPTHPIAPGGGGGSPEHPIYLPPGEEIDPPTLPQFPGGNWEMMWSPRYGWIWVSSSGKPMPLPPVPPNVANP
jgi:hypothetical protein